MHEMVMHELVPLMEEHDKMVGARGSMPLAEARDYKWVALLEEHELVPSQAVDELVNEPEP